MVSSGYQDPEDNSQSLYFHGQYMKWWHLGHYPYIIGNSISSFIDWAPAVYQAIYRHLKQDLILELRSEPQTVYVYMYYTYILCVYTDAHNFYWILIICDAKKFQIKSYKDKYHGPCLWVLCLSEDIATEVPLVDTHSENGT